MQGTCSDNDWDEIVLASIKVYVSELQDVKTAEKIASKLVGSRSKVIASIPIAIHKTNYNDIHRYLVWKAKGSLFTGRQRQ